MTDTRAVAREDSRRRPDAEALLERLADENLPLDTSLDDLLRLLDARCAAAGGAR